jgi:hypothetical protein
LEKHAASIFRVEQVYLEDISNRSLCTKAHSITTGKSTALKKVSAETAKNAEKVHSTEFSI